MGKNFFYILISIVILYGPAVSGQQDKVIQADEDRSQDLGYMYAFSEATKMFIFGDYGRAASLYKECLKYEPESSAVHYQLAEVYLKAGDLKTAHRFAKKAYFLDPENKWYTIQMANIYQAEEKFDSAIAIYKTLLNGSYGDIRVNFKISGLLEKKGEYKDALEYLNRIEERTGITKETAVGKARIYDRLGMRKEAMGEFKRALSGKEEDYVIYGMMAEFYRNHHNGDSAEYYYKKVIGDHQEDENLMLSYGEFLLEQKRIGEAKDIYAELFGNEKVDVNVKYTYLFNAIQNESFFRRVRPVLDTVINTMIGKYPDDVRVMSLYSDVNYRLGRFESASRMLKNIIANDENNYTAWEQLIFCESAMDKPDSVIYYGELAISKFDKRPLAYLLVSSVYYTKNEFSKALGLLKQGELLADSDPLKVEFYSLLAECYGKIKESENADKYYENALVIDSLNVAILNNYAYSLSVRGENINKAEAMSKYTVTAEPYNATFLDTYAWIMFRKGEYHEAYKYIRKAIKYGGNRNAEVLGHYGDILMKLKKTGKAMAAYHEAMQFADEDLKAELNSKIKGISNPGL